jgi:hypothetical protein
MSQESSGIQGAAEGWPSLNWPKRNELAISEINQWEVAAASRELEPVWCGEVRDLT